MDDLGTKVRKKRGFLGVREAAKVAGISPATLSRVEAGRTPDLDTFKKLCIWLEVDPGTLLGTNKSPAKGMEFSNSMGQVFAHFRAEKTLKPDTSVHLAELIKAINKEL